jgi:hypothetical protein
MNGTTIKIKNQFLNVGPYRAPLDNFIVDQTVGVNFVPYSTAHGLMKETPAIELQWYIVIFITAVKNMEHPLSVKPYDSSRTCKLVWEECGLPNLTLS